MCLAFRHCSLTGNIKKKIFCCKAFKKVLKRGAEILSALFCKKCPFLLTLDAVQIF